MTTKNFIKKMDKLGFYVENLEPSELNIVSEDPKTYDKNGWSDELADIATDVFCKFWLGSKLPDSVVELIYEYANTPLKGRKLSQAHVMQ